MPPIIQAKAVMYTVKDLLHTLNTRDGTRIIGGSSGTVNIARPAGKRTRLSPPPPSPPLHRPCRVHLLRGSGCILWALGAAGGAGWAQMLLNFGSAGVGDGSHALGGDA